MTQRTPFLFLVTFLFVAGIAAATFRHESYDIPWFPGSQALVWQVEARIEFTASGGTSDVFLTLPPDQGGFERLHEAPASSGWGFSVSEQYDQRRAHWTQRDVTGQQVLFYKLDLIANDEVVSQSPEQPDAAQMIWDEPYETAVQHVLD